MPNFFTRVKKIEIFKFPCAHLFYWMKQLRHDDSGLPDMLRKWVEPEKNKSNKSCMRHSSCCSTVVWIRYNVSFGLCCFGICTCSVKVNASGSPMCSGSAHCTWAVLHPTHWPASVFHCAVRMQLICSALKCGAETLMSLLRLPVVVLRLSVSELGEQHCPLWAAAFAAPWFPRTRV